MIANLFRVVACTAPLWCLCGSLALAAEQHPIEPTANGTYLLPAQAAELKGKSVQRSEQSGALEDWSSIRDRANWKVNNPKMGNYDVAVTWSVVEKDAPQAYN